MTKRFFDILVSLIILILCFPVVMSIACAVYLKVGSPVLFKQQRPGRLTNLFEMIKFRTMSNEVDDNGQLLPDKERMSRFGLFLRSTSLDELPELWNVIRGDMSLVGPRPLLKEYIPLYTQQQLRRHEVRPGITGWAQINGRNTISWEKKFELDLWYVDNRSFWLDLKILFMTVIKILTRDGVTSENEVTTYKFTGKDK